MAIMNLNYSLRYHSSGRKRKTKAFTCSKQKHKFVEYKPVMSAAATEIANSKILHPSLDFTFNNDSMKKKESKVYTGDFIIGIATMHKSNSVPVTRGSNMAVEIAKMRR